MLHRTWIEYYNIHKNSKRYQGQPLIDCNLGKICKTRSPRYPKNTFPEVFCIKVSFFHLISNGLNGVIINSLQCRLWLCFKLLRSIFSKSTQPFDFIRRNIIWKLTYKVKYINEINEVLIIFFANSGIRFFKLSWLDCEQYGKNQNEEKEHNQHSSVFSVQIIFILLKFYRFIDKSNDCYPFM